MNLPTRALGIWCCAMLLAACGDPEGKLNSDTSNSPNNSNNSTNNPTNGSNECVFDADCADGQACEAQACVNTCSGDPDCPGGWVCREGINTTQLVCQVDEQNNPPNIGNTNNPPNISTNNRVVYYAVEIRSTTTDEEACFIDDPGPDLFGVGLEDVTGAILGWGVVDWDQIQFDGNAHTDVSVIDGNGPSLGADVCPDQFDGNVVSLGCGFDSFIIVSFVDSSFDPIPLDAAGDQVIRVYEWGGQCTTGGITDTYNVSICTDTSGARSGDTSSCNIQIIVDGAGETAGEVGGF